VGPSIWPSDGPADPTRGSDKPGGTSGAKQSPANGIFGASGSSEALLMRDDRRAKAADGHQSS
jgi:hypothetical protein